MVLNPIDNLWSTIKVPLRKCDCSTKNKLYSTLQNVWDNDAELTIMCHCLMDSLLKYIQMVIKAWHDHNKYKKG